MRWVWNGLLLSNYRKCKARNRYVLLIVDQSPIQAKLTPQTATSSQIYACQIPPSAYFTKLNGGPYDRDDYRARPEAYKSVFADKVSF